MQLEGSESGGDNVYSRNIMPRQREHPSCCVKDGLEGGMRGSQEASGKDAHRHSPGKRP